MTRKDYKAIADALYRERMRQRTHDYFDEGTVARIVQRLETIFEADNPRFDRERFQRAVYRDYENDEEA